MEHTPLKNVSLRSTPKGKVNSMDLDATPKKVRFSLNSDYQKSLCLGKENKIFKAEDVLSMLNDSSLSEEGETSSDEEWIVTKSKALRISDSPIAKNDVSSATESSPLKEAVVKVTPIKLLRKAEYEVNKVPAAVKKTAVSVSPIVIKRKTDGKNTSDSTLLPLTTSSKCNISKPYNEEISPMPIRKSQRKKAINPKYDSDTENGCSPPKRRTPSRRKPKLEYSRNNEKSEAKGCSENVVKNKSSDSEDDKPLAERLISGTSSIHLGEEPSTKPSKNLVGPKMSACKKKELCSYNEILTDSPPSSPDMKMKLRTPRTSARKKLELSSPVVPKGSSDCASPVTPRRSARKKLELSSPVIAETYYKDDSSSDQTEEFKTPKRKGKVLRNSVIDSPSLRRQVLTPKHSAKKKLEMTPPRSGKKIRSGFLSPIVKERTKCNLTGTPSSRLDMTRASLHTSNIPSSLPCREKEYNNILSFTMRKIEDRAGGCMYISGVPGTGKTATVHAVIKLLQEKAVDDEISDFDFVEVNALRLTEPRQAYSRLWQELSGNKCSPELAMIELEKKFNKKCKRATVILVDELDYLCNRRQDVIYNILEWSTKSSAALTVITIANTMDLPERTLKGKVTSRMGLTRLVFQPYTFQQLQQIVLNRIGTSSNFHVDAVQLVARKVAAVSGDARRALDICRRATEMISSDTEVVKVSHIEKALTQIFTGTRVTAIKKCSVMNQFLLRAMRDEFHRTGVEETTIVQVYPQFNAITTLEGYEVPPIGMLLNMSSALADSGLILAEKCRSDINRKLSLNVSPDDIHYALSC
ncbi:origin recognition complex subunit 1 [Halyomorpha halys]|uniref:origin recognition complex subunit 1 n=1 Tax=Halyomorpha halys TaxID=286706 RepID=UPI0006D50370|nr:origin recognition complex subunit 1 [Halyomorpha halys]